MLRPKHLLPILCSLGFAAAAVAQDAPALETSKAVRVLRGATATEPVTPFVFNGDVRDLPRASDWQPGDPIKEIPRRRTSKGLESLGDLPAREHFDSLLDAQLSAQGRGVDPDFGTLLLNQNGQGFTGVNPPDPSGDVAGSYFIQAINGSGGSVFVIYSKTSGAVVAGPTNMDSLGSGNCASGAGDPIVLYDNLAGRWFLSEFSGSGNRLCVYISQTSDPVSGGWFAYQFTAPSFPDYPKYGVWHDAYYVGTNESSPSLYALDRTQMLAGAAAGLQRFTATGLSAFGFDMMPPVDHDGSVPPPAGAPGLFVRHNDDEAHSTPDVAGSDRLELYEFDVDWATPANSSLTGPIVISIAEISSNFCGFTTFSCIPTPGSSNLDPLREVVMNKPTYRNFGDVQVIVGSLATNVAATPASTTNAGVRWFELRNTGGGYSLFQEGTVAGTPCTGVCDFPQRWMSSTVMDASGNIATVYNFTSDTTNHQGLRYSGRLAADAANTMPQGEHIMVTGTASNSSIRYGDYNQLNLDDTDGCTFFYTGEWNAASSWSTRIASFRFADCGAPTGEIFSDGFELGNTSAWSLTQP